jgi:hypothetical protein
MFIILTLASSTAFGQQSTVIGTINRLPGSEITIKTPRSSVTIYASYRTEVAKDKIYRDLSPLKVGDEISAHCELNSSGRLVAIKIWATVVEFAATVKYVDQDNVEVVTNPKSESAREEHKIIHLYPDTAFSTNRKDLTIGQDIRVVGLDVGNGAIDAARVALYNTDLQVTK